MSNMSYCRFENTLADLLDCQEALDEFLGCIPDDYPGEDDENFEMSPEEFRSMKSLIEVCGEIAERYGDG